VWWVCRSGCGGWVPWAACLQWVVAALVLVGEGWWVKASLVSCDALRHEPL